MGCANSSPINETATLNLKKNNVTTKSTPNDELYTPFLLTSTEKLKRLREVELFVLDNSVRETTVAQIRGHTMDDKYRLMDLVSQCAGIKHQIVGTFGTLPRVDDIFAKDLKGTVTQRYPDKQIYCFSEIRDEVIDGIPSAEVSIGSVRAAEYQIPNVIIELDLLCPLTKWEELTMGKYCELLDNRVKWIRKNCSKNSLIFVNIRDFNNTWVQHRERIHFFIDHVARRPEGERIFGLAFEDPTGSVFPSVMGDHVHWARQIMDKQGWTQGHLLLHVHHAFSLSEACVLEALSAGATGVWCGICKEGAASGHANSLTTVVNLHRLGNEYVRKNFNLPAMRQAAIEMTKISTGQLPHPTTELYGSRALDICFDGRMGGNHPDEFLQLFAVPPNTRITTMANRQMFAQALTQKFGQQEWDPAICDKMVLKMHEDLNQGRKEEYDSIVGLAALYQRAGGKINENIQNALMKDKELEEHPLIQKLHDYFMNWHSCPHANDQVFTYLQFYEGFLAQYLKCFQCDLARQALHIMDLDENGFISWDELVFRAKWVIKEFPKECYSIESTITCLFEKYIMPEIALVLRNKSTEAEEMKEIV